MVNIKEELLESLKKDLLDFCFTLHELDREIRLRIVSLQNQIDNLEEGSKEKETKKKELDRLERYYKVYSRSSLLAEDVLSYYPSLTATPLERDFSSVPSNELIDRLTDTERNMEIYLKAFCQKLVEYNDELNKQYMGDEELELYRKDLRIAANIIKKRESYRVACGVSDKRFPDCDLFIDDECSDFIKRNI